MIISLKVDILPNEVIFLVTDENGILDNPEKKFRYYT
jgi:hypothetical protein